MPVVVMGWISVALVVDSSGSLATQRWLGAATWVLLFVVALRETPLIRMQAAVVVVFASAVEYTFSPLLEVYVYRFDNVPAYVPPGHGLVYLAALAIGRSPWVQERARTLTAAVIAVGGAWALWGLVGTDRTDALGAFWFACLVAFLLWGPNRGLYLGAFLVVSYLEIMGTALGTWRWQTHDPTGLVPIGNPPSGAAGGYGWFDLAALVLAPMLLTSLRRLRRPLTTPGTAEAPPAESPAPARD